MLKINSTQIDKTLEFIHYNTNLNKLRVYRWKLISYILPNQQNLYTWKRAETPKCPLCNLVDTYQHFFIECKMVSNFWKIMYELLSKIGFTNKIQLNHFVFGYKIYDKDYWDLNIIFTVLGFSIYKAFYVSELRKKSVDILKIFKNEFHLYFNLLKEEKDIKGNILNKFQKLLN